MSLFDGLGGGAVVRPNVVYNQGPLPSRFPVGEGSNAERIDGVINGSDSLLGDGLVPYSYGSSKHLSTQQSYLNVPHRVQKLVPLLSLPAAAHSSDEARFVDVSHAVDDGDVAFVVRMQPGSALSRCFTLLERIGFPRSAISSYVNVSGVNYILAGLQRHARHLQAGHGACVSWGHLWAALGLDDALMSHIEHARDPDRVKHDVALHVIRRCVVPFGVVHGSERQGGLHEGATSAATWPVSFVTSMVVDGDVRNLSNAWTTCGVSAGSELAFVLEPAESSVHTLNHYTKGTVTEAFDERDTCYLLQPAVDAWMRGDAVGWYIGMSRVSASRRPGALDTDANDARTRLRGALLEATFSPVFFDDRDRSSASKRVAIRLRRAVGAGPDEDDESDEEGEEAGSPAPSASDGPPADPLPSGGAGPAGAAGGAGPAGAAGGAGPAGAAGAAGGAGPAGAAGGTGPAPSAGAAGGTGPAPSAGGDGAAGGVPPGGSGV